MQRLTILLLLSITSMACYAQQRVTLSSLLKELTDNESVAHWPDPAFTEWMASSYDRRSITPGAPGWYGNNDFSQYIRTEQKTIQGATHTEQVMLDTDGPGAIVRFWLTTTEQRDGILRIYLDNKQAPTLTINSYDLMASHYPLVIPHSSYQPKGKGGSTMYLPIPFAKHCTVTWEEKTQGNTPPRYYQINYRKYEKGTSVRSFTPEELHNLALAALIKKTKAQLWNPPPTKGGQTVQFEKHIGPNQAASIRLPAGASQIESMEIKVTAPTDSLIPQVLRSTVLKMSFDGHQTVWCPIGDFSGAGVGSSVLKSWYRTVTADGTIRSRWIMPYRKSATIALKNTSIYPVNISMKLCIKKMSWQPSTMYFHASWQQNLNATVKKWDTAGATDFNMVSIKGKGVYLGNTLAVFNHMHTWYGEGDQKIWRDHKAFPIEFGTGLEDYYNTSWAPVIRYQTPFANAPRADNPDGYGYNTFTRTRNLDRVPFDSCFRMDVEMLGWQTGKADFAATVYWYGFDFATDNNNQDLEKQVAFPLPLPEQLPKE